MARRERKREKKTVSSCPIFSSPGTLLLHVLMSPVFGPSKTRKIFFLFFSFLLKKKKVSQEEESSSLSAVAAAAETVLGVWFKRFE